MEKNYTNHLGYHILLFLFTQSAKCLICIIVYFGYFSSVIVMKLFRFILYYYLRQKDVDNHIKIFFNNIKLAILRADIALFFYEFLKSPFTMGSIYPSSKKLAQCMAQQISPTEDRIVVELGAGTGIVTKALLKHGIKSKQLVVIEKSSQLAQRLQKNFPNVLVIEGDAINLVDILTKHRKLNIGTIVSSLPLRSLPVKTVQTITGQIHQLLDDKTQYIQFTYDLRKQKADCDATFYCTHSKTVWLNFPPALVNVFISNILD